MKIQMKHIQLQNCPRTRTGFKGAAFRVLACLMMFISFSAFAQKNNVSGVVIDVNTNEPVAGAALMVKGTSTGTVTNPDGTYTIKAGANDVIVCQFFGYKTLEIEVAGRAKVDFALEEDVEGECFNRDLVKEDGSMPVTGETLSFKVIALKRSAKKVALSHAKTYAAAVEERAQKAAAEADNTKKAVKKINSNIEKTTLGDLDALAALKSQLENK